MGGLHEGAQRETEVALVAVVRRWSLLQQVHGGVIRGGYLHERRMCSAAYSK